MAYFTWDALTYKETLETALNEGKFTDGQRDEITDIVLSIGPNDNPVIFWAKTRN